MSTPTYSLLALLLFIALVAGCSGSGRVRYNTPEEAFTKGKEAYDRGKYDRAIRYFQGAFDFGRSHEWGADAQFYLARSYRGNRDRILAANEYTRFAEIYRRDPRVPMAEYERALTYYEQSPNYQLDQTNTERALDAFQLFVDRFSTHELVPDAIDKIDELNEKLARKQYDIAQLYERRELFEAAGISYEVVFDKYPGSSWADDALLGALRSFILFSDQSIQQRQAERLRAAINNYERLQQLFPNSPLLEEAEPLHQRALQRMQSLAGGSSG